MLANALDVAQTSKHNLDPVLRVRMIVVVAKLVQCVVDSKAEAFVASRDAGVDHVAKVHDHLDLLGLERMLE